MRATPWGSGGKAGRALPGPHGTKRLVVGITGATGTLYGVRLLQALQGSGVETHLVVSRRSLREDEALWRKLIAALVDVTQKINADKAGATKILNDQLKKETGKALKPEVIDRAMERVELTWDPIAASLKETAQTAHKIRFLRSPPQLEGVYSLDLLNAALRGKNLPEVHETKP